MSVSSGQKTQATKMERCRRCGLRIYGSSIAHLQRNYNRHIREEHIGTPEVGL